MAKYFCTSCGVQYANGPAPPPRCIICEDDRQFVPRAGQGWVTAEELAVGRFNGFRKVAHNLFGIWSMPQFAIGQRAFLVITPAGNVLWDCISFLDQATVDLIRAIGGLKAIAVSHPHFYSAIATWGRTFDCPVLVNEADKQWIVDPEPCVQTWTGDNREVLPNVTLHRLGGHFPGSTVLHWADRRTLLSGDTVLVTRDRKHVSFMWSYPNYVPLSAVDVERLGQRLSALDFDALYSAFWEDDIDQDAKLAIERSVARHIQGPNAAMNHPAA